MNPRQAIEPAWEEGTACDEYGRVPRALALRFTDWCLWYGKATRRWWALPPTWCRQRVGLLEADTPTELAAQIQHIEDFRLHLVPEQSAPLILDADTHAPQAEDPSRGSSQDIRVTGNTRFNRDEGKGGGQDGSAIPVRTRRPTR
ncbi:hypothetical protein [Streptosporangium sp. NPDC049046]|uniref:hypothetical protein n=1 Tax=Streptosporangium sp. NPDC049046 TaxID=3155031 RepID=UPI00343ABBB7